jgi:hypothetical protein
MKTMQKMIFFMFLFLGTYATTQAQQLISKSEKSWKIHWGVTGGAGVSNFLENSSTQIQTPPEGFDDYTVKYAPRPEVTLGLFTEFESQCKFLSFRTSINYMMRSIPEPTFYSYGSAAIENPYKSIYLNGLYVDGILFFKPLDKVKFGLGFDLAQFFMTNQIKEGQNSEYAQNYVSYRGLKTVISYNINARTDLNMYVSVGNSTKEKMQVDNVSGGITIAYKVKGREYKIKKEVYSIDYVK